MRSPGKIECGFFSLAIRDLGLVWEEIMDFITNFFGNINFEVIAQLTMLALIVLAGPAVILVLASRGGDL